MASSVNWPLPDGPGDRSERSSMEVKEKSAAQVVGSTELYVDGKLRLIPLPSPDPKDPLNLPEWRKWTAIGVVCFFGSLALSAEVIIGALLPVFLLEYSGVDPRTLNDVDFVAASGGSININPLSVIPEGVEPAPLEKVTFLATVPLLANGIASYFLVPLSIAVGRRPVLLFAGACAWIGGLWAGLSTSLDSHLAARAMQGLGAGAVEALIPLVVQDIVFLHQRNKAMSAVVSSQGLIIISLGIAAPYIAVNHTWRWLYFITSGFGILAWLLLILWLPETRWVRSQEELSGEKTWPVKEGQDRPELDLNMFTPRTWWTNIGVFHYGLEWKRAFVSMLDTLRTTLFPAVIWAVLTNCIFITGNQATAQLSSFALLSQGWKFELTGLAVVPFFAASFLVYVFGGPVADRISNAVTRHNGGKREAEYNLANLILPFVSGVAGLFIFGYSGENNLHWAILMLGAVCIIFGFLTVMTVLNVFIVESYPQWAGPVLVNVSSLRIILAFFLSSKATTWVAEKGLLATFSIYAEAIIVLSLGIPLFFFFGKKLRGWTSGRVQVSGKDNVV